MYFEKHDLLDPHEVAHVFTALYCGGKGKNRKREYVLTIGMNVSRVAKSQSTGAHGTYLFRVEKSCDEKEKKKKTRTVLDIISVLAA